MKRNSNSKWYVSGLGVLLLISMSMLLLVGCASDNPVSSIPDNPPDNPDDGADVTGAIRPGDPDLNPPVGFDKGDDVPLNQRDREDFCK